jgi:hypothetical protein
MADAVAPGAFASRLHQKLPGLAHLTDADTQARRAPRQHVLQGSATPALLLAPHVPSSLRALCDDRGIALCRALQADSAAAAALRGHLLLQLVHRAWEEKLEGNCAALQDLVRPLQLAMADPGIKPEQLANLAAVLVRAALGSLPLLALGVCGAARPRTSRRLHRAVTTTCTS